MEAPINHFAFDQVNDREEEEQFVKLFHAVLQQNRGNLTDDEIADGVLHAIQIFKMGPSGACNLDLYNDLKSLCGFFHRFSALYAGITRNKFLSALHDCEELSFCFGKPTLKIVDVGSGAGSDLVGLFSALYDEKFEFESLQVIALDYNNEWEFFYHEIINQLRRNNFGNASRLIREKNIENSFLSADLLNYDWSKFNDADIILMKGFLSILDKDSQRSETIWNIASAMKPGSLLIIIESPVYMENVHSKHLRFVFTTMKSGNLHASSADKQQDPDSENVYRLRRPPVAKYGRGFSVQSNQQIYIYKKK